MRILFCILPPRNTKAYASRGRLHAVGVDELRYLAGTLQENVRGLFVSRIGFTREAYACANTKPCVNLMPGGQPLALILAHCERLPACIRNSVTTGIDPQ